MTGSLAWSSSIDGTIGSGGSFSTLALSLGTHTITASVADGGGLGGSDSITVTINAPPDTQPPAAPTNLTASVQSSGRGKDKVVTGVVLSWSDNSGNETGFVVERCLETGKRNSKTCDFDVIKTVAADVTTYTDSPGSGTFKYRVKAANDAGYSAYSNEVKI